MIVDDKAGTLRTSLQGGASRPGDLMWIFGHGSLMFRPAFVFARSVAVRVAGWERRFGQPSVRNWGRPGAPAPTSSLVPGSHVDGVAFGVAERDAVLARLMKREASDPIGVVGVIDGRQTEMLTWPMQSTWADLGVGDLVDRAESSIRAGGGPSGDAWAYVSGVRSAMDERRIHDPLVSDYQGALAARLGRLPSE